MSITPQRWRQIESLFEAALDEPEADRRRYVDEAADGDAFLRDQVLAMLRGDLLDGGPVDTAVPSWFSSADQPDVTPARGTVIGSWEVREPLGEGGMGVVYRARRSDGAYEQEVALKLVHLAGDAVAVRRFADERQILARLSHPGIARLLDGGTTPDGVSFLVMELVDGEPIDVYVRQGALGVEAILELVLQVGAAVDHAHRNLIVHGDIKPANVLVAADGRPRLLDFGIARVLGRADAHEDHGYLTPGYASPERLRGQPLTTAADVFSMGQMLSRLLAGVRGARVGRDLRAVIERACHPDAESRYEAVVSLCEDLRRVMEHRPVVAVRSGLARAITLFARRNWLATSLAALAVAALVVGALVSLDLARTARIERDTARLAREEMLEQRDHAASEAESAQLVAAFLTENLLASRRLDASERERLRAATIAQATRVRRQFAGVPHMRANLLDALADTLARIGYDTDSEEIVREALGLRRDAFGAESLEVALSHQSLGELLYGRGQFEAALAELERAYVIHRGAPDSAHADVATAANNVAACLRALGRRDEARRLHEEALALRVRAGRKTLPVAETLNNLGVLAIDDGDMARAQVLLSEAVETRGEILGRDAPLTLQSAMNLASVLWYLDEKARAIDTLRASAAALRPLRGAGDPQLLQVLKNLAGMEILNDEAEAGLVTAREARAVLGRLGQAESRAELAVLHLLARAQERSGRFVEAAAEYRAALELLRRIAPDDGAAANETSVDLALCLVEAEDHAAAGPILLRLNARREELREDDASLVVCLLALCESAAGEKPVARELVVEALPQIARRLGPDHPVVRRVRVLVDHAVRQGR